MELYLRVRLACHVEGLSQREAASRFGIARDTVRKMLRHSEPPGYRRRQPPKRPKLDPFTDIIDRILEEDRTVHRKQRHTAKRIFDRLRDEHGFTGGRTIVKDYVRERRRRLREMFIPLAHPLIGHPGGLWRGGCDQRRRVPGTFFVMTLPRAIRDCGLPAATRPLGWQAHFRAFAFFGGVPQSAVRPRQALGVGSCRTGTRHHGRGVSIASIPTSSSASHGRPARATTKAMWNFARRNPSNGRVRGL